MAYDIYYGQALKRIIMQLLTPEWAEAYTAKWNNDDELVKKLRKFSSVFKYIEKISLR